MIRHIAAAVSGIFYRDKPEDYIRVIEDRRQKLQSIERGRRKVIAVGSGKGGQAKSVTAREISYSLAELGLRVALFDLDFSTPAIREYVRNDLQHSPMPPATILDFIRGNAPIDQVKTHPSYLDEADHPVSVRNLEFYLVPRDLSVERRVNRLLEVGYEKLQQVVESSGEVDTDFIVLDLPAGKRHGDVLRFWARRDYGILVFEPIETPLVKAYGVLSEGEYATCEAQLLAKLEEMNRKFLAAQQRNGKEDADRMRSEITQLEAERERLRRIVKRKKESEENKVRAKEGIGRINAELKEKRSSIKGIEERPHTEKSLLDNAYPDIQNTFLAYSSLTEMRGRFPDDIVNIVGRDRVGLYEAVTGRNFRHEIGEAIQYGAKPVIPILTMIDPRNRSILEAKITFERIVKQQELDGLATEIARLPEMTELVDNPQFILHSEEVRGSTGEGVPLISLQDLRKQRSWSEASRAYRQIAWEIARMEYLARGKYGVFSKR